MNKKIISILSLISLVSCSNINTNKSGVIKLGFTFPEKSGFSIKAIPNNTESFQINISGEGLGTPIEKKITKDNSEKVLIQEIPSGNKTVIVKALDNSGKLLAQAEEKIEIKAGEVNKLTMELKELLKNFKIKIRNFSSNTPYVLAEFKANNKTIQEELKSNEIELKEIEPGQLKVKISSYAYDSTPMFNFNKTIDTSKSNSEEIDLEQISLPKVSELDASNISPIQFQKIIDTLKIDFKDNKTPRIEGIELLINGKNVDPSFNRLNPSCVSTSDSIKISVKVSDQDNDKINFFWGQNSLIDGNYKMQLNEEREASIFKSASDLGIGNHSIGFVVTDRKSFIVSPGIYFNITQDNCK
jgi:cell division septum initiation protein DivIVA